MDMQSVLRAVAAAFVSMNSMSQVAEGGWTRKADMPTARGSLSTSVVDDKVYAIGGARTMSVTHLSTVEAYEPVTDTWTRRADMPTSRHGQAASVVNDRIYVIGGRGQGQAFLSAVEMYDPTTDTWTRKADMPTKRAYLCTCVVDGKIYAIGGRAAEDAPDAGPSALEVYDPATDTWIKKPDMPIRRAMAAACVVDGGIYVIGGVIEDSHGAPLQTVDEYVPATDTWTRKADMPTARMWHSASVVGNRIYVLGGEAYGGPVFSAVEEYDPVADTWNSKSDMLTGRGMLSVVTVNGRIYALGGTAQWYPLTAVAAVEEYDLTPAPPDFNGDGRIDGKDVLVMADCWGQDDAVCDIAPAPFGDGLVDVEDLIVLAEYIGAEVEDRTLIAHWRLDEVDGITACDSAGSCDATLCGDPLWQPDGGAVNGAVALDGIDDFLATDFVLDPSEGPFSVLAWVKGGALGQVLASQVGGANWLIIDGSTGTLATELTNGGRIQRPLLSEAAVTDGNWHRIGLTWDGNRRSLYVDDTLVATDEQINLAMCTGGLNIGCGDIMASDSFWSGLIDDVRIYNRAVAP